MSTTAVSAGQIMDRVANLLNDPNKTDYTYRVMVPYLNMAIEELSELLEESNSSPSQGITSVIVPANSGAIFAPESAGPGMVTYPSDLTEIQEVAERLNIGSQDAFIPIPRRETQSIYPVTNSLLYWYWEDQIIKFNPYGASVPIEVRLIYIRQGLPYVVDENSSVTMINSRAYLAYKTAAFCSMFIGENETRAAVLQAEAEKAVERITAISNKGRQQIVTRHRPFRAAYKMRSGF